MRKQLLISVLFLLSIQQIFATEDSTFFLSQIQVVDDRTVHISFSEALAREPVSISIIESNTQNVVDIKEIKVVEPERLSADITTLEPLKSLADYTFVVGSARSMSGNILAQKWVKEGSGITLPQSIPVSSVTTSNNTKGGNIDEVFKKAQQEKNSKPASAPSVKKDTSLSSQRELSSLNSASSDMEDSDSSQDSQTKNPVLDSKRLPKTGAETWYIAVIALFASLVVMKKFHKRAS